MLDKKIISEKEMVKKSPTEEGMTKGGAYIVAASKLQFYPTDFQETLRSLSMLPMTLKGGGKLQLNSKQRMTLDRVLLNFDQEKGNEKEIFIELANMRRLDIIEKYIGIEFENTRQTDDSYHISVLDPFGGTGSWLDVFKFLDNKRKRQIKTIYNEIELNKYEENKMKHDYSFNMSAEEFIPMLEQIRYTPDVILFNPPYGQSFGERNAKVFLKEIMKITGPQTILSCALNEKDIRDCMEIIDENFIVIQCNRFKNEEEFKALGQYYIELQRRRYSSGIRAKSVLEHMLEINNTDKAPKVVLTRLEKSQQTHRAIVGLELKKDDSKYVAPTDSMDFIKSSLIPTMHQETIYMPKKPSFEETCSLIANGKMNGEVITRDGEVLYVCGVNEKKTQTIEDEDEEGVTRETEVYATTITVIDQNRRLKILSDREMSC